MAAPTPLLLFENVLTLGTLTVTSEVAGWPKENALDWRLGTAYRYRSSAGVAPPHRVTVDLGPSLSIAANTFVLGGHNLTALRADGAWWDVEWSDDGAAWTSVSTAMWATAGFVTDNRPWCVRWTASAHRWWRLSLQGLGSFLVDPRTAALTLGRALSIEGLDPETDLNSVETELEFFDNENGDHVGTNIERTLRTLQLSYGRAGLLKSTVFRPASGLSVDVDLRAHLLAGLPVWYIVDRAVNPTSEVYLCSAKRWSMPFFQSTSRRRFEVPLEAYREIS